MAHRVREVLASHVSQRWRQPHKRRGEASGAGLARCRCRRLLAAAPPLTLVASRPPPLPPPAQGPNTFWELSALDIDKNNVDFQSLKGKVRHGRRTQARATRPPTPPSPPPASQVVVVTNVASK